MKEEHIKPINRIVFYDFSLDSFDFESILPGFFSGYLFLLVIHSFLVAVLFKDNGLVSVNIFSPGYPSLLGFYRISCCILLWFTVFYRVSIGYTSLGLLGFTGFS